MKRSYGLAQAIRTFNLKATLIKQDKDEAGRTRFRYYVYRPDTGKAVEMSMASHFMVHTRMNSEAATALQEQLGLTDADGFDAGEWLARRYMAGAKKWRPAHAIAELLWYLSQISRQYTEPKLKDMRALHPEWRLIHNEWYQVLSDFSSDDYNGGEVLYWLLGKGGWLDNANDCFSSDYLELKWG